MAAPIALPTKEQVQEFALNTVEDTKKNLVVLQEAGLFKGENALTFAKELATPFDKANFDVAVVQSILLAKTNELFKGFTIMNAVAFLLEVCGALTALLLGGSWVLFSFELVWAFSIAYVLYWLVVCADGNDYKLVAIGLYVIYSIINTVQALSAFALVIPGIFFMCKTVALLCCAVYAFKIEKLTAGATMLKDDGVELGVAE